jgi:LPS export ABC transporter protein LptC
LWAKGAKQKRIRLALLAVILLIFGVIIAAFVQYRKGSPNNNENTSIPQDEATVAIGKVHQTATRDGKPAWRMDAGSVRFVEDREEAFFKDISIVFFLETGEEIFLTAKEGILKTDSNDIEVNGDVVIRNADYRLETKTISYGHEKRMITSNVPVAISGPAFNLTADSLQIDLNKKAAEFKGNIKGNIDERNRQ